MTPDRLRAYVVLDQDEDLSRCCAVADESEACEAVLHYLRACTPLEPQSAVRAVPSRRSRTDAAQPIPGATIVVLDATRADYERLRGLVGHTPQIRDVGIDLPLLPARHWCPGRSPRPSFGDRSAAERLIRAEALRSEGVGDGAPAVRVAIFDAGLATGTTGPGAVWPVPKAGEAPSEIRGGHGMATARQILALAPHAELYDYRILPERISDPDSFVSDAIAAYEHLNDRIATSQGPWVVVNAWSVFDRTIDPGRGANSEIARLYSEVATAARAGADVVFAAGNCGQFCPDPRCAKNSRGPGASILGVNALPDALCVGAVRCDGAWMGYSSQGPGLGAAEGSRTKPDLCAPSGFREDDDAATINTGTSTACGLAAGVIAALRREFPKPTPDEMRAALVDTARSDTGGWSPRLGHGILDAAAARKALQARFGAA